MVIEGALLEQLKRDPRAYYVGEIVRRARLWREAEITWSCTTGSGLISQEMLDDISVKRCALARAVDALLEWENE